MTFNRNSSERVSVILGGVEFVLNLSLFRNKIQKTGSKPHDCWLWAGTHANGYPIVSLTRDGMQRQCGVHRVMYSLKFGDPRFSTIGRTCMNPGCIRPTHLKKFESRKEWYCKIAKPY